MSGRLEVVDLRKTYPPGRQRVRIEVPAVRNVSFTVEAGSFFTIVGPSGCGKTTTLRCIAGLERPDGGDVRLDRRVLFSAESAIEVPVNERGLGMVFQAYALWPHMTVFANVAFPLTVGRRSRRVPRDEV